MSGTPKTVTGIGGKVGQPPLIDGNVVMWFAWKDDAKNAARAIGWPLKSIANVMTRFQYGYAIAQQGTGEYLTKEAYATLRGNR